MFPLPSFFLVPSGSILRRWKRNWFVLWLDGSLVYYQDETQRDMEGRVHIKFNCRGVKMGRECRGEPTPPGLTLLGLCPGLPGSDVCRLSA